MIESLTESLEYRVKILAYNVEGETYSDIASIIVADVPSQPQDQIRKVSATQTTISVEFDGLTSEKPNGLVVLSYSLEIDYDLSGDFT